MSDLTRPQAELAIGFPMAKNEDRLRDERGVYVGQPEIRTAQMRVREAMMLLNRRGPRTVKEGV